ncbi:MAG: ATP-binding protein [Planctomycetota bacterium]
MFTKILSKCESGTDAFPFGFVIDSSMRIVEAGRSLRTLIPEFETGRLISEIMEIHRPRKLNWVSDELSKSPGQLILIQALHEDIRLRAECFVSDGNFALNTSPVVNELKTLEQLGLTFSDFPLTDSISDNTFIWSMQQQTLREAEKMADELARSNEELKREAAEKQEELRRREAMEQERERLQEELIAASREAGKAEIATGVLHNVGNVMNTVTVSSGMMQESLRSRVCDRLDAAIMILEANEDDLPGFFQSNQQGHHFIPFMKQLGHQARSILDEVDTLRDNVDHVNSVVAAQQSYATTSGFHSLVNLTDAIETSLQIVIEQLRQNSVTVIQDCVEDCVAMTDRQKLIQVLVNLFKNANHSIEEFGPEVRELTIRLRKDHDSMYSISVTDTGLGMTGDVMDKIFQHGFTTRKQKGGHGFGLHHSVIAMEEMGGSLSVESEGPGKGATFHLKVPSGVNGPASRPDSKAKEDIDRNTGEK